MTKDKYIDLVGHPGIRVRVDHWVLSTRRERLAFITPASPSVRAIVEAEAKIIAALKDLAMQGLADMEAPNEHGEVIMFHGTFVKIEAWCLPGTATRLGIKGYGPQ